MPGPEVGTIPFVGSPSDLLSPRLIITVGLPGSGKSTYLRELGVEALASDELRRLLLDDVDNQSANRLIFSTLRSLVRIRLGLRRPATYVDATHLSTWERRPWIAMADLHGCTAEAIYFDVPFEECLARNRKRSRQVPEDVMRNMANRLTPPTAAEGFHRIITVRETSERPVPDCSLQL